MVRVVSTKEFDAWERLLPKDYQEQIENIIKQLKETWKVGKPLGYSFFREKNWENIGCTFWCMKTLIQSY